MADKCLILTHNQFLKIAKCILIYKQKKYLNDIHRLENEITAKQLKFQSHNSERSI